MDGSATAHWDAAYALTVSFPSDGTQVGPYANELSHLFAPFDTAQWKDAIVRGLQVWASKTAANVGLIPDDGSPFGARPLNRTDLKFGDVRVGAIPMSPDVLSISVPNDERVAGSWAGDILFNSKANFATIDDIFRVALHEAGHVFGLDHNADPNSPMHAHGINGSVTPTTDDLAALAKLYGARGPDRNELSSPNDTIGKGTRIRFEDDASYNGGTPAIEFGDINSASDIDVFEIRSLVGYAGPVDIQITANGISQLSMTVDLLDFRGNVLQTVSSTAPGQSLNLHLSSFTGSERQYVRIRGVGNEINQHGSYAILQRFTDRLTISEAEIQRTIVQGQRLIASSPAMTNNIDMRRLFGDPLAVLNDDSGTDDVLGSATALNPSLQTPTEVRYQSLGSISLSTDVDFYRVRSGSPSDTSRPQIMTIQLESLDPAGLVSRVTVEDHGGVVQPMTILANGHGIQIFQVSNVASSRDYFIKIAPDASQAPFDHGNYRLTVRFDQVEKTLTSIADSPLTKSAPQTEFTLYIAQTQLMQLGIVSTSSAQGSVPVWAAIYDAQRKPVYFVASLAGETRTTSSVLLQPGEYRIQLAVDPTQIADGDSIDLKLFGDRISHPIGPPVIDPAHQPLYVCPDTVTQFCYPGGTRTIDPTVVVPPTLPPLPPPAPLPLVPPDRWFWTGNRPATNPLRPLDVDGDTTVSPLDVLVMINRINSIGGGAIPVPYTETNFYDPDGDGVISPLDVLVIINFLNAGGGASGEGESAGGDGSVQAIDLAMSDPNGIDPWNLYRRRRV